MDSDSIDSTTSVLVTGGAGFIGSHLVETLLKRGCRVTILDNFTTGKKENLSRLVGFELVEGDFVESLKSDRVKLESYDYLFHLAGSAYVPFSVEHPETDFKLNLENTILLLETLRAAKKTPKLIFPSSASVYGNPIRLPVSESDITIPVSPYGVGKLGAERYISVYCQLYGLRAVTLRLFSVYGQRQRKQVVYDLLSKLNASPLEIQLHGDGSQTRDFIHVRDVVNAMLRLAESHLECGDVVNVGSGVSISINELVAATAAALGINPQVKYVGHVRPGDVEHWSVNVERAVEIGITPSVSLKEGLLELKEWFFSDSNAKLAEKMQ